MHYTNRRFIGSRTWSPWSRFTACSSHTVRLAPAGTSKTVSHHMSPLFFCAIPPPPSDPHLLDFHVPPGFVLGRVLALQLHFLPSQSPRVVVVVVVGRHTQVICMHAFIRAPMQRCAHAKPPLDAL